MRAFVPCALPPPARRRRRSQPLTCAASASSAADRDLAAMRRCVDLARRASGQTRPNPPVGCVLHSSTGELLGEGYHRRVGGPHAEVAALRDAAWRGNSPAGATAYVSLEPCNHFGRTPPCSRALVAANVARVVVGVVDPNPKVAGQGIATLKRAGIQVEVGVEGETCAELVEGFVRRVERKRPFGVLKYAMTLDGKIATEGGSSKWVTGEHARGRVHEIRAGMDAIIVGGETLRKDDPRLTVRDVAGRDGEMLDPIRVVMSRSLHLPRDARLWDAAGEVDTVVLTSTGHGEEAFARELRGRGVVVEEVPGLGVDDAMAYLYDRDCLNVLWECGGGLAAQAVKEGAVQKVHAFVAPKLVGGEDAPSPLGQPALVTDMGSAIELRRRTVETFENGDILVTGYLE